MEELAGAVFISEKACRLKGKEFFRDIYSKYDMLLDHFDNGELYEGLFVTGDTLGDLYLSAELKETSFIDEQDIDDEEFAWMFEEGKEED